MNFKRFFSLALVLLLALTVFAGCGTSEKKENKKISIVTTIYPEYDWVKTVVGKNSADVTLLLDNGVDLHSYQPTATDIVKISESDLFIYVGGESDKWVEDILKTANNKNMQVINLIDVLGDSAVTEEAVEGMQSEAKEDEEEIDEHVWISLKNTEIFVQKIADVLAEIDKDNASSYKENASNYIEKIKELDAKYTELFENTSSKTLLFCDRFPFRYLKEDYGISYYAAFLGCSAESEASFETVSFLAKKVDELGLKYVFVLEKSDKKIAKTVIENTSGKSAKILSLNSLQSEVSGQDNYLSIMEKNYEVLKTALS